MKLFILLVVCSGAAFVFGLWLGFEFGAKAISEILGKRLNRVLNDLPVEERIKVLWALDKKL